MTVQLDSQDARLLNEILECGRRLEEFWSRQDGNEGEKDHHLTIFRGLVQSVEKAQSSDLRRLVFHARSLTRDMTARHLAAVLVPFERLGRRTLRDDQFLIDETDQNPDAPRETVPMRVIADNIRSAFNVGAVLRTAEGLGLERAVLTGYTSTPDDDKTAATSMGAHNHIPWQSMPKLGDAIACAKAEGFSIVALETVPSAKTVGNFAWPAKCALIIGNERFGLESDTLAAADHVVRIPLHGRKNSLNVAIAFGIAAADFVHSRARKSLWPIGVFRGRAKHPYEARRQASEDQSAEVGEIVLNPGSGFEAALSGLTSFTRIWLLFGFHQNAHWKAKVLPPRGPHIKQGVFATRSPYRPNGLGLSSVELLNVDGLRIQVRGFDLLDESPVYDIKPYLPYADAYPNATAGWAEGLDEAAYTVCLTASASGQLQWLETKGIDQLRGFIYSQLEFDPLDRERKRLILSENADSNHVICYRTWRAEFRLQESTRTIEVARFFSAYSSDELHDPADPYRDKEIHREFSGLFY